MPKGADLHNHLSGAVYAEDYIRMATANQLCVNPTDKALSLPPCAAGQRIDQALRLDPTWYDKLIDAWSMRDWQLSGESGHDHFFAAFGKFGAVINEQTTSEMLAAALSQAASDHVSSVELMLTPNSANIRKMAQGRWNDDFQTMARAMTDAGLGAEVQAGLDLVKKVTIEARARMGCKSKAPASGCSVGVRFLFQGQRGSPREQAFALFLAGFEMVMDPENRDPWTGEPLVVGVNLVQPEDSPVAIKDFSVQMAMLDYLHTRFPAVHIALHAGELAPGLVPPADLAFHIRESVERGHAERIGHGVDVMSEDKPYELLQELASRGIALEICLSSNDQILGVRGRRHPLSAFIKYGVPVTLATDDEGVARSSMTNEYMKAVEEQGLGYVELKAMARTSLQFAFVGGQSLWKDPKLFVPVDQCRQPNASEASKECMDFLKSNRKAEMQWRLEREFDEFESSMAPQPM
jgi:adenosine deaminase/adenosine deaminase CECR1